jgi:hypothetical protein
MALLLGLSAHAQNWSEVFPTTSQDKAVATAVDVQNQFIYYAGEARSDQALSSPIAPYMGGSDGFLMKYDYDGNLLWSTYIGGSGDDAIRDITIGSNGDIYILGNTLRNGTDPLSGIPGVDD